MKDRIRSSVVAFARANLVTALRQVAAALRDMHGRGGYADAGLDGGGLIDGFQEQHLLLPARTCLASAASSIARTAERDRHEHSARQRRRASALGLNSRYAGQ
jgi:hypothetical protein